MMDRSRTRRVWIALAVAIALATVFRVLLIDSLDRTYFAKYIEFADALRNGTIVRDRIPDLSPGYLWFIALLRGLGVGVHAIRTLQIVLLSGVALVTAAIAYRLSGTLAAVFAAVLVMANKAALVNATDIEPETLLLFFNVIGLVLVSAQGAAPLFLSGLAFGIAATLRPVALLGAAALLVWLVVQRRRAAGLFAIGALFPVFAFLLVNRAMTGSMLLMDPGTVFYEGMNPNATGYAGVTPRIVKDIEPTVPGSDTMHVAYRIVAARALRHPLSREEANRYWSQKARAFVTKYPVRAMGLVARKARLLVSSHDAYDLPGMVLKDRALRGVWISWSLLVPLALGSAVFRKRGVAPIAIYAVAAAIAPVVFFVTARHRNPLLIAVAVLGGVAIAEWPVLLRRDRTRGVAVAAFVIAAAAVLSIPGDLQREDDYLWTATLEVSRLMAAGDGVAAATWLPESVPPVPPNLLRPAAMRALHGPASPARSFSIAGALLQAGDAATADQILRRLQSIRYTPFRRTRGVSSVAYYRARAALQLRNRLQARHHIAEARAEAPGDADVLALSAFLERDMRYLAPLDRIHDPFTRDWALARAAHAVGAEDNARQLAARAASGCPECAVRPDLR